MTKPTKPAQGVKERVTKPSASAGAAGAVAGVIPLLPPNWQPYAAAVSGVLGIVAAFMRKP